MCSLCGPSAREKEMYRNLAEQSPSLVEVVEGEKMESKTMESKVNWWKLVSVLLALLLTNIVCVGLARRGQSPPICYEHRIQTDDESCTRGGHIEVMGNNELVCVCPNVRGK